MTAPAALPPLYAGWIDTLLGAPVPSESNATCSDCAMVVPEGSDQPGYNPSVKCCTFLPDLWNFLVGRVLLDDSPDAARGRATVEARIDQGLAVTPLGLRRDPKYQMLYEGSQLSFGNSRAMLCPHYLPESGGLCGVWRHRESTCTTWFCKFERGAIGRDFWRHLHQLLRAAEESLAAWCLLELGVEHEILALLYRPYRNSTPSKMTGHDMDGQPDTVGLRQLWGKWLGRERELYRESARLVAPLGWDDVLRIGGSSLRVYAHLTQDAFERMMSDAIPARPVTALVQITPRGHRARLATYSESDLLDVPAVVAKVLPYFDGRPTDDALAEIRRAEGVIIEPSLVRKLTAFGVLKEAP